MRAAVPLAVWLLACPTAAWAQARASPLVGRVVDATTGEPVAGAVVESRGVQQRRTETDAEGRFRFMVTADTVELSVWRLGYVARDTMVAFAAVQGELVLTLERRPIRLRGLTAHVERGAGAAERMLFEQEVTPGVVGVSRQTLRDIPAVAEPDVLRSLQALPGVTALNDLSAQLHIWGGAPDQNLFLLDGARILAPYHMFGLFGAFNVDAVERAELFRTVLPARRGGALTAAVEVEQRAGDPSRVRVDGGVGFLGARAAARGPLPWQGGGWMLAARRTHADAVASIFGDDFPYAFHDAHARFDAAPGPDHRIRLSLFTSADRFRMFLHDIDDDLRSRWRNAAASARWAWRGDRDRSVSAEAWWSHYRGSLTVGGGPTSPATRNRVGAGGVRLESVWRGDESGIRLGLDVEGGRVRIDGSEAPGGYILGDVAGRYLLPATYVEAEQRLGPVRLAPGLRAVYAARRDRMLLEPRLSARLSLGPDVAITLGAGRSHQLLSTLRDDRYPVPGAPFWFVHPADRPVSRADGIAAELQGWVDDVWQFRLAGYMRSFSDVPRWRPIGTREVARVAFDDGRAAGVEVSIRRHTGRWTGWLAYGLARVRLDEADTGRRYYAAWDRRHALDLATFLRAWPGLTLSARLVYGSGLPFWPPVGENDAQRFDPLQGTIETGERFPVWATRQMRLPAYVRFDLGARYTRRIGRVSIEPYLSVVNVTARENVLYYTLVPPGVGSETRPPDGGAPMLDPQLQLPLRLFPTIGVEAHF